MRDSFGTHFRTLGLTLAITLLLPTVGYSNCGENVPSDFPVLNKLPPGEYTYTVRGRSEKETHDRPWSPPENSLAAAVKHLNELECDYYGVQGLLKSSPDRPVGLYIQAKEISSGKTQRSKQKPKEDNNKGTQDPLVPIPGENFETPSDVCSLKDQPHEPNWETTAAGVKFILTMLKEDPQNPGAWLQEKQWFFDTLKKAHQFQCSMERANQLPLRKEIKRKFNKIEREDSNLIYNPPKEWIDIKPIPRDPSTTPSVPATAGTGNRPQSAGTSPQSIDTGISHFVIWGSGNGGKKPVAMYHTKQEAIDIANRFQKRTNFYKYYITEHKLPTKKKHWFDVYKTSGSQVYSAR